jgi:hypothetical protein
MLLFKGLTAPCLDNKYTNNIGLLFIVQQFAILQPNLKFHYQSQVALRQ